jgi:hypothetical protein
MATGGGGRLEPHNGAAFRATRRVISACLHQSLSERLFPDRSRLAVDSDAFRERLGAGCDVVAGSRELVARADVWLGLDSPNQG